MRWLRARIRAFGSFKKEQSFEFPEGPGLFFLTGRNEAEPRLGANGAGKSTLWEALFWLWFGKTATGLTAGQVAPWDGTKGTRVELDYEHGGLVYTLGRTWSPNRWYLVHEHGADELLLQDSSNLALEHLGVGALPFLNCILMAQKADMFLDLKAEAATSLFSQVMDLDKWLDRSARAGQRATEQDREMRTLESKVARLQGQLVSLSKKDTSYTSEDWERDRKRDLDEMYTSRESLLAERKKLVVSLKEADGRVEFLQAEVHSAQKNLALLATKLPEGADALHGRLRSDVAVFKADAARIRRECNDVEDNPACTACGHHLTADERNKRLEELLAEEDSILDRLHFAEKELSDLEAKIAAVATARVVSSNLVNDNKRNLEFAKLDVSSGERELKRVDGELDRLEDRIIALEKAKNPVLEADSKLAAERLKVEKELSSTQADLVNAEYLFRLFNYWVKGFKDIRLSQVADALTQLEVEVNSSLAQLGLADWRVLFKADSETKAGGLKRGFSVEVLSPANAKPVSWKSWSGGESQRLRLAGNMGFADLIRARTGVTLPIEVWDEPTQYLSPQGVTDLLDGLSQRAHAEQRQIWLVDHRSLGYGSFDGVVTVVKDAEGSRFEF